MFYKGFSSIAILLVLAVILCSCKNSKEANSADIYNSSVIKLDSEDQFATGVNVESGALDPQNTEGMKSGGETIDISKVGADKVYKNGIDVSKWQGKIDWSSVKSDGVDFAVIRVGYRAENGKIYKDSNADYNIQQADKAGLLIGVYFFSTAVNTDEAEEEAKWVYENIKSYSVSLPVVYDCEGYNSSDSRMYNLTAKERTDNALNFINQIKSYGYEAMFYASVEELENNWQTDRIESISRVWVAHYGNNVYPETKHPEYGGRCDMWQYTNKGIVKGISGSVDLVVSYFWADKADPKSDEKVQNAPPPAEKGDIYTAVSENVTAKDEVNLRAAATTSSEIVGVLKNGEILKRTAVGTNGWSKLDYNGKTVYVISSYITTDTDYKTPVRQDQPDEDGFTPLNDKVTPKISVNLRKEPTTDSQIVATVDNGEVLERTGINKAKGWSRISYKGGTVYVVSSMVTDDLDYEPETDPDTGSSADSGGGEMRFHQVSEKVTAKIETNLRDKPAGGDGSQVVYTLKNGEYVIRTGYSDQGWSRLEWQGRTVYAVSSYLVGEES